MIAHIGLARRQSKDPLERYDTPAWVTRALLDRYPFIRGMHVIEPCAGARAVSRVLAEEGGCRVRSFDIAPRAPRVQRADTLRASFWRTQSRNEIICTNPAFSIAAAVIRHGLKSKAPAIVLLLRLSWLEMTADRHDIPDPDGLIVVPRPRFIESPEARAIREKAGRKWSSDACTVAWMIWQRHTPVLGIVRVNRAQKAVYERQPLWRRSA
jgi:hypothetical protein